MPFLNEDQADPSGLALQIPHDEKISTPSPPLHDVVGSAFRLGNTIGMGTEGIEEAVQRGNESGAIDKNFDPFTTDNIRGYEDFPNSFIGVKNAEDMALVKAKIDGERRDMQTVQDSGFGWAAMLAAGVLDPVNLIPIGGEAAKAYQLGKLGRIAEAAALTARGGAVAGIASEAVAEASQETRKLPESIEAVGAMALLGGVLGAAGAGIARGDKEIPGLNKARTFERTASDAHDESEAYANELEGLVSPSTAGAAQVVRPATTKEQETLKSAFGLEKALKFEDPLLRAANSDSVETRRVMQELAEQPLMFKKNDEGIASPVAAETRMRIWQGNLYRSMDALENNFIEYRTGRERKFGDVFRTGISDIFAKPSDRLSYDQFSQEVARAMRRGDKSDIPGVAKTAQTLRSELFNPLKNEAIQHGLLPKDVEVVTAPSYLTRLYNTNKIVSNRPDFERILTDWLAEEQRKMRRSIDANARAARAEAESAGKRDLLGNVKTDAAAVDDKTRVFLELAPEELRDTARQITDHILGYPPNRLMYDVVPLKRGPLKERTLNIPDALIEQYLENDIRKIAKIYQRTMAADVELTRQFGRADMQDQIDKVMEEYSKLREKIVAGANPEEVALQRMNIEKTDIGDQFVIPGGERSAKQLAQSREDVGHGKMVTDKLQRPADEGLFSKPEEENKQGALFQRGGAAAENPAGYFTQTARGLYAAPAEVFTKNEAALRDAITNEIKRIAPHVEARPFKAMREGSPEGDAVFGAYYRDLSGPDVAHVVAWSLEANDARLAARHEAIHALKRTDLFKPAEWKTLEKAAKEQGWLGKHEIEQHYPDLKEAYKLEEAIAEEFSRWRAGESEAVGKVKTIFGHIKQFLDGVAKAVKGILGQDVTADDIFARVESGEVGSRAGQDAGQVDTAFQKKQGKPVTLLQFLAQNGGLKDSGGDVKSMIGRPQKPMGRYGMLINKKKGMQLDAAMEKAAQAGYFRMPGETASTALDTQHMLDAIDKELRGQPHYRDADIGRVEEAKAQKEADTNEVTSYAESLGINTEGMEEDEMLRQIFERNKEGEIKPFDEETAYRIHGEIAEAYAEELAKAEQLWQDKFADLDGRSPYPLFEPGETATLEDLEKLNDEFAAYEASRGNKQISGDAAGAPSGQDIAAGSAGASGEGASAGSEGTTGASGTVPPSGQSVKQEGEYSPEIRKQLNAIDKAMNRDIADIQGVRDRLRGTYAIPDNPQGLAYRAGKVAKNLNYLRLLGGMTISALPDMGSVVFTHGISRVFSDGLKPLVENFKTYRLVSDEVKRAGAALDMVLDSRVMSLADVMDEYGRNTMLERGIAGLTDKLGHASLMSPWNASLKQFVGVITQTRTLQAIEGLTRGEKIDPKEMSRLAYLGIDKPMAARIGQEFKQHGIKEKSLYWANTQDWKDVEAAVAYRGALTKEVERTIVTPGQDKPFWMSKSLGSVVSQFKSFSVASVQRMLISGLQRRDLATLNGTALMVGLGMLAYYLKTPTDKLADNPSQWVAEGVDRSGLTGWLFDANNFVEKASRNAVGISALTGRQTSSRFSSTDAVSSGLGPTFGLTLDMLKTVGDASAGDWQAQDTHNVRRMIPFQNLFYVRSLFDAAEQGVNNSMGIVPRN